MAQSRASVKQATPRRLTFVQRWELSQARFRLASLTARRLMPACAGMRLATLFELLSGCGSGSHEARSLMQGGSVCSMREAMSSNPSCDIRCRLQVCAGHGSQGNQRVSNRLISVKCYALPLQL